MTMTPQQYVKLHDAIIADPELNAYPNNSDGNYDMCAKKLNVELVPKFTVWKTGQAGSVTLVPLNQVGMAMDGAELANLTTANTSRLQVRAAYMVAGESPSTPETRTFYDSVFSIGGATRTNLAVLWKRAAWYGEKILALQPTGTDAAPATMGYEGAISPDDVAKARSL